MKKGQPLKPVLQKIDEDKKHKQDYLVNLKSVTVEKGTNNYPEIHFSTDKDNGYEFDFTDYSLGQLCNKLEIGTSYIRKCLPYQEMVAYNLNQWISKVEDKDLMIRTYHNPDGDKYINNARAILSNRYKRLDHHRFAFQALNKLMDIKAEVKYCEYDGDYLNLTAVTPKLSGEVKKGDVIQGGVTITNSEIGTQTLLIQPFIYRLVCTNGMVIPRILNSFVQKHLGKVLIDLERDDQDIKIIDRMQKQIELISNPKVFQENLQKLKDAEQMKTNSTKIVKLFKHHSISDSEKAEIYAKLKRNVSEPYFETDHYSLANAITNYANSDDVSEDRSRFLQELGGLIIFAHNPNAIKLR